MQPLKCTCGTCPTCRHREYQRRTRTKKNAPRQPRSEHLTVDEAERLSLDAWLRLPKRIQARVVNDYCKESTQ